MSGNAEVWVYELAYKEDLNDGVVLDPGAIANVLRPANVELGEIGAIYATEHAKQKEGEELEQMPILSHR